MCIGGTPYVCSHIILLSTPIITDDPLDIAHRERVPNGALPKLGRVLTPLWGRTTPSFKKRRLQWRCVSLFNELLCHHENILLPWVALVWQTLYRKELLAKQDIIAHWYYWTRLLISSFADCKSFLCARTHILFSSSRAWLHLRYMPMELLPASQYVFINGVRAWTYMEQWSSATTSHRFHHSTWLTACQDIVIHWLMLFFIKLLYKAGCHIYVPEIFRCTWTQTVIVVHRLHLCSWSNTVHGHILFGHDCWARCHEGTPCV